MSELETLSLRISDQVNRQISLMREKSQQLKQLIEDAETMCRKLEENLHKETNQKNHHLKIVRKPETSNPDPLFQLDKSPFLEETNLLSSKGKEKDKSTPPLDPTI